LHAVTKADIHRVVVEAMGTSLLQVPDRRSADWAGFAASPTHSATAVTGDRFPSLSSPEVAVVVGSDGVSIVTPAGPITVRYHECAAALRWPDGARRLIGFDGTGLQIEPTLYAVDSSTLDAFDAAVHPATIVSMPKRAPDAIPRPAPERSAQAPTAKGGRRRGGTTAVVVWSVITALVAGFALLATAGMAMDGGADTAAWTAVVVLWLLACVPAWLLVVLLRKRRRT
jgi:zinc protease